MTIKQRLYISFFLILLIIIFIIGVFFYSTYNLNEIHLKQTQRYDRIRKVEKLKEYNNTLLSIVRDISEGIDKEGLKKIQELFDNINYHKLDIINRAESNESKSNLILIFENFEKMENIIKNGFNDKSLKKQNDFENLIYQTQNRLTQKVSYLQEKLDETEKNKEKFIDKIKIELVVLLLLAFLFSFIISSKIIKEIQQMLGKLNEGVLQLLNNEQNTIKVDIGKNNELSEITDTINTYLKNQENIIHSREELLRNISHELKTPITKGKFLIEKYKEEKCNGAIENINHIFLDIEELTSKLLQREKLNFVTLNITKFKVSTLILQALSKLSIDDESKVFLDIKDDFDIKADKYYLTMALKNLIDNAMKYADTYPILIKTYDHTVFVENTAKKLSNDFIYYIQPFTREPNQQQGHGLGLNIVNKIVQMHSFGLKYDYQNSRNIFSIIVKKM